MLWWDRADPELWYDISEAADIADPIDPADANEPMLAKEATDAALPIERNESWEQIERTEFSDQSDHMRSSVVPAPRPGGTPGGTRVPQNRRMEHGRGMELAEVIAVLAAVRSAGCCHWLEGGWGVDALVGRQTRPHRDVDADYEDDVLAALAGLGYSVETDWRPNRVELWASGKQVG